MYQSKPTTDDLRVILMCVNVEALTANTANLSHDDEGQLMLAQLASLALVSAALYEHISTLGGHDPRNTRRRH